MSDNGWPTTTIDIPGAFSTAAVAMAPDGEVIGVATFQTLSGSETSPEGFVFNGGTAVLLGVPGASGTTPYAINAADEIVGTFTTSTGPEQGFIDNAGTFTTLDDPGALNTFAVGINGSGTVIGWWNNGSTEAGSYMVSGTVYSAITVSGGSNVTAEDINDSGDIVGFFGTGETTEGFVEAGGTVTTITVPGAISVIANAINASGTIAGYYTDSAGHGHGFLDAAGSITTFDPTGAVSTLPLGLTDSGEVYGFFTNADGTVEAFIGIPGTITTFAPPGALDTIIYGVDAAGGIAAKTEAPSAPGSKTPGPTSALFVIPCFCAGTRIRTDTGEVAVERLRVGDPVRSIFAGSAAVIWIGERRVGCERHPRPDALWPVRIRAGAFAARLPRRDLLISPDHAVFVDGILVPVRHLINGSTILQWPVDEVTYYHVELAAHDVILANGLPCESYLDTGNRAAFIEPPAIQAA